MLELTGQTPGRNRLLPYLHVHKGHGVRLRDDALTFSAYPQ